MRPISLGLGFLLLFGALLDAGRSWLLGDDSGIIIGISTFMATLGVVMLVYGLSSMSRTSWRKPSARGITDWMDQQTKESEAVAQPSAYERCVLRGLIQKKSPPEIADSEKIPIDMVFSTLDKLEAEGFITEKHYLTKKGFQVARGKSYSEFVVE